MRIALVILLFGAAFATGWLISAWVPAPSPAAAAVHPRFDLKAELDGDGAFCLGTNDMEFDFIPLDVLEAGAVTVTDAPAPPAATAPLVTARH